MEELLEYIYFKKRKLINFQNLSPLPKEKEALEKFDDTLTEEQRRLFREYERLLKLRVENLQKEFFRCGFEAGIDNKIELLKAHLKR
ncbi:MAG: hypothetical protein IJF39_01265 [Clostridia bacterium]|nr:hypothetical protein [Clostridia bacterium]